MNLNHHTQNKFKTDSVAGEKPSMREGGRERGERRRERLNFNDSLRLAMPLSPFIRFTIKGLIGQKKWPAIELTTN